MKFSVCLGIVLEVCSENAEHEGPYLTGWGGEPTLGPAIALPEAGQKRWGRGTDFAGYIDIRPLH